MKGELLKKKANISRLTVFKNRTDFPTFDPPSNASKAPDISRKRHPSSAIDDSRSTKRMYKRQHKHQVIKSDDEDDPESKSQIDCMV